MRVLALMIIGWILVGGVLSWAADSSTALPNGTTVRVQSPELIPGWHIGKLEITREGCAMVWMSSSEVPGGRKGVRLMLLAKLERQEGTEWIDVPIKPLIEKEPKNCHEGAG
ncbi:MAG TPA: hypothetical protein VHF07_09360 [Nitrospiraceae bacterium]|nr:hypothetical protein [Nitrospiraceae bacterium]